jgi:ornithine cyclodeaminase/alanine dehydrogenase-like protein (mu-crystallin family)
MATLLLSRDDVSALLTMEDALEIAEAVYHTRGTGDAVVPAKVMLDVSRAGEAGSFKAMSAYFPDLDVAGIKFIGAFPHNPSRNLPYLSAVIVLSDPKNGLPLAVMDGLAITAARTGAAAAITAKFLKPGMETLAVIGTGFAGRAVVQAFDLAHTLTEVRIHDASEAAVERTVAHFKDKIQTPIRVFATATACVENADVVVTATHADEPLFAERALEPGALFIPLGSHREFDPDMILRASYLVVDHIEQSKNRPFLVPHFETGGLSDSDLCEIGTVVAGASPSPDAGDGFGIAVLTGVVSLDIALAERVFSKAEDRGLGTSFSFCLPEEEGSKVRV